MVSNGRYFVVNVILPVELIITLIEPYKAAEATPKLASGAVASKGGKGGMFPVSE